MDFDPGLKIGEEINNDRLCEIFLCSGQGGMRKSNKTNTLVIISKHVGRIYDDRWIGETLHYTGMGLEGDQEIHLSQNKTLSQSKTNGVDLHLFEKIQGEGVHLQIFKNNIAFQCFVELIKRF